MFTFGFYDSLNGDRRYTSSQMSEIFDGIIQDGVYSNVGEALMTIPGGGLQVIVKTGRAWFKHTWSLNDAYLPLSIDPPDVYRDRIDSVVLEVNKNLDVRANSIKVIKGEPATSPTAPVMIHEEGIDQYRLSDITVHVESAEIVEADIANKIGMNETPFVQCPLKTVSIEDLFIQWNGEFNEWFDNLKAQLSDNVVANLQGQIDKNGDMIEDLSTEMKNSEKALSNLGSLFLVSKYYNKPINGALLCDGSYENPEIYSDLFDLIGYSEGATALNQIQQDFGVPNDKASILLYNPWLDCIFRCSINISNSAANLSWTRYNRDGSKSSGSTRMSMNAYRSAPTFIVIYNGFVCDVGYTVKESSTPYHIGTSVLYSNSNSTYDIKQFNFPENSLNLFTPFAIVENVFYLLMGTGSMYSYSTDASSTALSGTRVYYSTTGITATSNFMFSNIVNNKIYIISTGGGMHQISRINDAKAFLRNPTDASVWSPALFSFTQSPAITPQKQVDGFYYYQMFLIGKNGRGYSIDGSGKIVIIHNLETNPVVLTTSVTINGILSAIVSTTSVDILYGSDGNIYTFSDDSVDPRIGSYDYSRWCNTLMTTDKTWIFTKNAVYDDSTIWFRVPTISIDGVKTYIRTKDLSKDPSKNGLDSSR